MHFQQKSISLFIDADNAPATQIEMILSELAKHGVVNIRRAYGNWKKASIKGWESILHEFAIQPIQQFDLTKGKNATDMALTIDVMDVLHHKNVDIFCIVSSDSDFTPLVMRIRAEGKMVIGFGRRDTPSPFVNACSTFLYLEDAPKKRSKSAAKRPSRMSGAELKQDTKLIGLLRNAIEATQNDDGWSFLAGIGSHIANQASFNVGNYGYKRLGDLIGAIDLFETDICDITSRMRVRDRRNVHKDTSTKDSA